MHDSTLESSYIYKLTKYEKFKNVFDRVFKFISNFLFIFFVVILLVMLVYSMYTKKNGNNGYVPIVSAYVIVSPSMVPTINVYDAVVSFRPNINAIKKGDIITFNSTDARYSGRTVTHRIIGVDKVDGAVAFRTKGDNNTTPDDTHVLIGNIYGKVFFVIPWLGYLQILLTNPLGWMLLVVFPCVGIILHDILKLLKTVMKSKVASEINFKNVEIDDDDKKDEEISSISEIDIKNEDISEVKEEVTSNIKEEEKENRVSLADNDLFNTRYAIIVATNYIRDIINNEVSDKEKIEEENVITNNRFDIVVAYNFMRLNTFSEEEIVTKEKIEEETEKEINEKEEKEEEDIDSYIEIL